MSVLKIYIPDNLRDALVKETDDLDIKVSPYVCNLIAQALGDKVETEEDDNNTPIDRRICKVRLVGEDADYIQRVSKELNITPKQLIGKLINEQDLSNVNIPFLEDFMDEFRAIENNVRKVCYYASRDDSHKVDEKMIREVLEHLDKVTDLFCLIYKELIKTKHSLIKEIAKGR